MFAVRDSKTNFCLLKVAMELLERGSYWVLYVIECQEVLIRKSEMMLIFYVNISNEISAHSRHRNKFCRNPTKENEVAFKKQ